MGTTLRNNPAAKTFLGAAVILLLMLFVTGLLTYLIPNGTFDQETLEYTALATRGIDPLHWIFAPVLVLFSDNGALAIAIILFLLIIGGSVHLLKETGLVETIILWVVRRFYDREFVLLSLISLLFMTMGALIGTFEEVVPLVPLVILLARSMGWDDLTGLGISLLAAGLGFSAAVTNPFTIGVAQQLAGLPMFSGALLRLLVFSSVYAALLGFLFLHIKRHRGQRSLTRPLDTEKNASNKAVMFFLVMMAGMLATVALMPFLAIIRDLSLPLIGLFFLTASLGVGYLSWGRWGKVFRIFAAGVREMSPAIVLILLATGIQYIMNNGNILGTVLYYVSRHIGTFPPLAALFILLYFVTILDFFISSGSAKAFILIPILMPIMDMMGVGRQLGILAYQFGDGFSNILFPTNAVLLIGLGLAHISYGTWIRYIWSLQLVLFGLAMGWLAIGYAVGYGL